MILDLITLVVCIGLHSLTYKGVSSMHTAVLIGTPVACRLAVQGLLARGWRAIESRKTYEWSRSVDWDLARHGVVDVAMILPVQSWCEYTFGTRYLGILVFLYTGTSSVSPYKYAISNTATDY
jgi:hypothetical protein